MIKNILIACLSVLMIACNNETVSNETKEETKQPDDAMNNTLTENEKKDGWQLLFDGASVKGWHKYGGEPAGSAWKVADSSLYLEASEKKDWQINNGGDIVTDDEFENFDLTLDWKIDTAGNSGIMFYIQDDSVKYEYPWYTGPEMQVLDNDRHSDAKINKHRAGDLYDLIASSKETVKPALQWNSVEIKSLNGKLDLFLNGENVVSTMLWDDNWKKLVAGSKFKDMPGFGSFKKGRIGLQDHGNSVWFRNIKIKKL
jgi:hypothetical protein